MGDVQVPCWFSVVYDTNNKIPVGIPFKKKVVKPETETKTWKNADKNKGIML